MKLSELLASRKTLIRQATLASIAQAYANLKALAERIAASNLRGPVRLQQADASEERYWVTLTSLERSPSWIEEHFTDSDLIKLAEAVDFAVDPPPTEIVFRLEDIPSEFLESLEIQLKRGGVVIDAIATTPPGTESAENVSSTGTA